MDMDMDTTTTTDAGSASPSAAAAAAAAAAEHAGLDDDREPQLIRSRVANACDGCKARKVKCDGNLPCSYCTRRQRPHTCKYSPPRQRRHPRPRNPNNHQPRTPSLHSPPPSIHGAGHDRNLRGHATATPLSAAASHELDHASSSSITAAPTHHLPSTSTSTVPDSVSSVSMKSSTPVAHQHPHPHPFSHHHHSAVASPEDHDEAEVPREARLLCDAQGKLIFIGDCAPLSFFQTVRQLVTSRVDPNAFAPQTSRYSVLENAISKSSLASGPASSPPKVALEDIADTVAAYRCVTSGMADLFAASGARLTDSITAWASNNNNNSSSSHRGAEDVSSVVYYLVLAIGAQQRDEDLAQHYFEHARDRALASLNGSLGIETVQAFILVTMYMLCACQINGAFLFFGIAVRAAYSIGLHRTEVNSRFGPDAHRQRDRLWKSLRIVDLFLSTSMGRPPCTSDVDCTVPYRQVDADGHEVLDVLNASVQIFLILEGIVLEVYSRRKISFQLTEGISRQLRDFSVRWLHHLKRLVSSSSSSSSSSSEPQQQQYGGEQEERERERERERRDPPEANGACQVLASYYYAVMLVSRPFLMYELYRRLSPEPTTIYGRAGLVSGKSKLADACIDAASMMVDQICDLIDKGIVSGRRPILVSWLFAGSLVLGAGLLGSFGRILEKYARMATTALDHFAKIDAHAAQYAMISKSLLATAVEYLEKREVQERLQRTESSAQLFGLIPHGSSSSSSSSAIRESADRDSIHVRTRSPDLGRRAAAAATAAVASPASRTMSGIIKAGSDASAYHHHHGGGGETPSMHMAAESHHHPAHHHGHGVGGGGGGGGMAGMGSPFFGNLDPAFLTMSSSLPRTPDLCLMSGVFDGDESSSFGGLNLFPLLETGGGGGHIDLAHYL